MADPIFQTLTHHKDPKKGRVCFWISAIALILSLITQIGFGLILLGIFPTPIAYLGALIGFSFILLDATVGIIFGFIALFKSKSLSAGAVLWGHFLIHFWLLFPSMWG